MLAGISEWTKQFTIKFGTKDLKVNAQWSAVRDPRETQSPEDYFQFQTSGQTRQAQFQGFSLDSETHFRPLIGPNPGTLQTLTK